MIVPPTPVVVPPTPVGGQYGGEKTGKERREVGDGEVKGGAKDSQMNGKKDERWANSKGTDEETPEDGTDDVVIVQSPEDEEPSIPIHSWNDASAPRDDSRDMDKTPQPRSPNGIPRQNPEGRKSPIPIGRSRSRSSSSSSQCMSVLIPRKNNFLTVILVSGLAPRRTKELEPGTERRNGGAEVVESDVETVASPVDVPVIDSPAEELVFDSPVDEVSYPIDGSTSSAIHNLAIDSPPSHATDPRISADPLDPVTKSDSAVPSLRSPSPKQIYDVISTSPTASACETPCIDRTHHKALHRGEAEGFFPVQEEREKEDEEVESPGGLGDHDWAGKEGKPGERDRKAEQEHVDSMHVARESAVSHSTESLHALRKQSEGFSPCRTQSGDQTPAALRPDKGKERMLSVDDGASEGSLRGRGGPGHHRRESSTHRYVLSVSPSYRMPTIFLGSGRRSMRNIIRARWGSG